MVFCESSDPKSDEIYSLITETCATSGILMCMLHDETEIIKTLKYNLMSWFDAQLLCEEIQSPLAIVEAWVHVCQETVILNLIFVSGFFFFLSSYYLVTRYNIRATKTLRLGIILKQRMH